MKFGMLGKLLVTLSFFACTSVWGGPLVVDVTGIYSHGELGDANNTVLTFDVGANSTVTSIGYSVDLTAFGPSYLSEMGLLFTNSDVTSGMSFAPGIADWFGGSGSYAGFLDLAASGMSFDVGTDGLLRLEFHEQFNDLGMAPDGLWNFGTITFNIEPVIRDVPEPATGLLLGAGLALIGYAGRRGRKAAVGKLDRPAYPA